MGAVAGHSEKRRATQFQGPTRDPAGGKGHATDITGATERAGTAEAGGDRSVQVPLSSPLPPPRVMVPPLFCLQFESSVPQGAAAPESGRSAVAAESRFVMEREALRKE